VRRRQHVVVEGRNQHLLLLIGGEREESVVQPGGLVHRACDERPSRRIHRCVDGQAAVSDEWRHHDVQLVLDRPGLAAGAHAVDATAVPGQRRAEDQVDPAVDEVARELGELDVGTDQDPRRERTEGRHEQLVAADRAERVLLRREMGLVLALDAAVGMDDVRRVAKRTVLRQTVVAPPDHHHVVLCGRLAEAVDDLVGVLRKDLPVIRRYRLRRDLVVGDGREQPRAGEFGEEHHRSASGSCLSCERVDMLEESLHGFLGLQCELHRGDGERSHDASPSVSASRPPIGLRPRAPDANHSSGAGTLVRLEDRSRTFVRIPALARCGGRGQLPG